MTGLQAKLVEIKEENVQIIQSLKKPTKYFYGLFLQQIAREDITALVKWTETFGLESVEELKKFFILPRAVTLDTKLLSFQYKLLYRCITTNTKLLLFNIRENDRCTFCNLNRETLSHLFWECHIVRTLWNNIIEWINEQLVVEVVPCLQHIILGVDLQGYHSLINRILLITKYYIYVCRCLDRIPIFETAIEKVKYNLKVEKQAGIKNSAEYLQTLFGRD